MDTRSDPNNEPRRPKPRVCFYHPNARGTGSALRLEPHVARKPGERCDGFFLEMAPQKTLSSREDGHGKPATFDWEKKITVKLGFTDICELLAVLEGKSEQAGGKRDGLYHQNGRTNTLIRMAAHEAGGCAISLSRKAAGEQEASRVGTVLSLPESLGLRHVLTFGILRTAFPVAPECDVNAFRPEPAGVSV